MLTNTLPKIHTRPNIILTNFVMQGSSWAVDFYTDIQELLCSYRTRKFITVHRVAYTEPKQSSSHRHNLFL